MLICQESTYNKKHEYFFEFKGKKYRVHSVIKLTENGRKYMGFARNEAILIEVYYRFDGRKMYKFEGKDIKYNIGIRDKSTDKTPDELIEEVVASASPEYASREMFGVDSPYHKTNGVKQTKKDWEIPEIRKGWIIFILVFFAVCILKDWYIQLLIRTIAAWIFFKYRQNYVDAYTSYTHEEENEILSHKFYALYGIKPNTNTEDDDNEQDS